MTESDASNGRAISVADNPRAVEILWGPKDANRRLIERKLGVRISSRGDLIHIAGSARAAANAERVLEQMLETARKGGAVFLRDVDHAIRLLSDQGNAALEALSSAPMVITRTGRSIVPKTPNQRSYLDAIEGHDLVFGVGPAGTGKTYLAMAAAVSALTRKLVKRIILTRPAVEAGEKLGFLPGTLAEKVNPYLRPLYDALYDLMDVDEAGRFIESGVVEVAPLAFMRGRTLNNSFVILDEAQNTTREQMKMFLTRLGFSGRAVVTGDMTQIDLPQDRGSGLVHAVRLLGGIEGIGVVEFSDVDVVRHPLVQAIVRAYEREADT